jgi:predicted AlkP superfamily pyrophosphatase or phosphodiesterase
VTGVAPARHGIVNNVFVDPERGRYRYESDPTWLLSEPLWSIVEGAGIRTASFHWVGSEGPWRSGRGPTHWVPFDSRTPASEKVTRILAWLDLPPEERPRLVTAWLRGADHAAHRHGPRAPEVVEALRRQDAELARLLDGLAERDLAGETTVLVVSDHGMMALEDQVDLAGLLDDAGVDAAVHGGGGFATVTLADPEASLAAARAAARAAGLEAWAPGEAPADLGLDHPRFGHLAVLAPPGTALRKGLVARVRGLFLRGVHGYRPEHPAMAAIFLARGRGVAPGARPGAVRALDVAPTVLALLDVPIPAAMEGRPIELSATLGASKEDVEPARGAAEPDERSGG